MSFMRHFQDIEKVAIVLTVYGIETKAEEVSAEDLICCNSTYRLRY